MRSEKKNTNKRLQLDVADNAAGGFPEKDERLIWELFKKGDEQSLIYLYRHYADTLFNYGRQFSERREYVRDCIQELFYDLIDKRKRLGEVQSVKGYLFASLKRKILRGLKKEEQLSLKGNGADCFEVGFSTGSIPLLQTFDKKDYTIIEKQLNTLPVLQKEVILLYFYEGLGYPEIAEIMGIKVKSARALTYRALESLLQKLKPYKGTFYLFLLHCFSS